MQTINIGKYTLYKATAEQYAEYCDYPVEDIVATVGNVKAFYWMETSTSTSAEVGMELEDGSFAYTSRFVICKATLKEMLDVICWQESL